MRKLLLLLAAVLMAACERNHRYIVISHNYKDTDTVYSDYYSNGVRDEYNITFSTPKGEARINSVNKIIAK